MQRGPRGSSSSDAAAPPESSRGPDQDEASHEPGQLDHRVEELEARATHQDRTLEDLDEVVREFARRVERLEADLRLLRAQLEAAGSTSSG